MKEEIEQEAEEAKTKYLLKRRAYGQGEVRINTFVVVSEDIYSLGFVTQLNDEIINKYFDVMKGELRNLDEDESKEGESENGESPEGSK